VTQTNRDFDFGNQEAGSLRELDIDEDAWVEGQA